MVAVGPPVSLSLEDAVTSGRSDAAALAAARRIGEGESPLSVLARATEVALEFSGREAAGASWSQALLSVAAAASLADREGGAAAAVGAIGFLAHARPSRVRDTEASPVDWPGTRGWVDLVLEDRLAEALGAWDVVPEEERSLAWGAASVASVGGWGAMALLGGGLSRLGAALPALSAALEEATIRAWIPVEPDPAFVEAAGEAGSVVEGIARAISGGAAPARAQVDAESVVVGVAVAALELARRTPDLRSVRGVLVARELLEIARAHPEALDAAARDRVLAFVGSGWDRARWDRRLRGAARSWGEGAFSGEAPPLDGTIDELCRVEARPGFGHNLLLAEAGIALTEMLPRHAPLIAATLAATVPSWTRSRRPHLMLRGAKNPQASGIVAPLK